MDPNASPAPLSLEQQGQKSLMPSPKGLSTDIYYNADRLNAMASFARSMIKSGAFSKNIQNEFQAIAILQTGAEMEMAPMEALDAFYIVNGKVTIYGKAVSRQLRKHGWEIQYLDEEPGKKVTVKVTKGEKTHEYKAISTDPVLSRSVAFKNDPQSKLRWHALSRLVKFSLPEVLGPASEITEEANDFIQSRVIDKELDEVEVSASEGSEPEVKPTLPPPSNKKSFDQIIETKEQEWESEEVPLEKVKAPKSEIQSLPNL